MLRIVIAEPDDALSRVLADALAEAEQFQVAGMAPDGESALDVVRRTRPDVVLVDADIVMPPEDGVTLVSAILDALPEALVIVLVAETGSEVARAALEAGAMGVLAKNGSAQVLTDAWSTLLAPRHEDAPESSWGGPIGWPRGLPADEDAVVPSEAQIDQRGAQGAYQPRTSPSSSTPDHEYQTYRDPQSPDREHRAVDAGRGVR
jgi:DNA-binding NarL/FixJ family response regulator